MALRRIIFALTTSGAGAASATAPRKVLGKLYAIAYRPGDIATGATLTVTAVGVQTTTLLVKATAGTSDLMFYPRTLIHDDAAGAALVGTSGGDREKPVIDGLLTVAIASGGATATGAATVYFEE